MEFCRHCGQGVMVQIQKNTGFCTPKCEEKFVGEAWCRVCNAWHRADVTCLEDE